MHGLAPRPTCSGQKLDRDALFFYVGWQLRTDLARTLGCKLRDGGSIVVDTDQAPPRSPLCGRSLCELDS